MEWLTAKQAAEYLQVNRQTLYRWIAENKIEVTRLFGKSGRIRIRRQSLERLLGKDSENVDSIGKQGIGVV